MQIGQTTQAEGQTVQLVKCPDCKSPTHTGKQSPYFQFTESVGNYLPEDSRQGFRIAEIPSS